MRRGRIPALPPYLQRQNFDAVRSRSSRVRYVQRSFTDILRESPVAGFDRYVLLDAQDWMNDAELTALWTEITRHRAAGRAGHLPHCRRGAVVAGARSRRRARRVALRRRTEP